MKFVILILYLVSLSLATKLYKEPILPLDAKPSADTLRWALEQTTAARNLFYSPNDKFSAEMANLSKKLAVLTEKFLPELTTLKDYRVLFAGTLKGKTPADLVATIKRVADNKADGNDRSSVMSFMGDLGTIIADYYTDDEKSKNASFKAVNEKIVLFLASLKLRPINIAEIKEFKNERAGVHFGPNKRAERDNGDLKARKGILETGTSADIKLKTVSAGKEINLVTWPLQLIERARLEDKKVTEPWAGHMSGSLPEILLCWDILLGEDPLISVNEAKIKANSKILGSEAREIRAVAAAANLIGLGFHSAMECIEPMDAYLGKYYRKEIAEAKGTDMAVLKGKGPDSTNYMKALMNKYTKTVVKRRMNKMK